MGRSVEKEWRQDARGGRGKGGWRKICTQIQG